MSAEAIQVSVEELSTLERKLTITVPAAQVDEASEDHLREVARNVRLPGFRPGKVPFSLVRSRYAGAVRAEVCEKLLQPSYAQALEEKDIRPAGMPEVDLVSMDEGKDFEFTATIEVYPEFDVAGIDGLKLERAAVEVGDADIEEMLEKIRKQHAEYTVVERAAAEGDRCKVDFKGTNVQGETFQGSEAEGVFVTLGGGGMPEEYEGPLGEALTGKSAGDEFEFEIKFPRKYNVEEIAGKKGKFTGKLHEVAESAVPELDDELAKKFGADDIASLRADLQGNMEREVESRVTGELKEAITDGLLEANEIEVPKALVTQEVGRLREEAKQQAVQSGVPQENIDSIPLPDEMFQEQADKRVRVGLIFGEVIRQQELKVDAEKVDAYLDGLVASYGDNAEQMKDVYRQSPQAMGNVEAAVLENQVVDYIVSQVKVKDVKKSFAELTEAA